MGTRRTGNGVKPRLEWRQRGYKVSNARPRGWAIAQQVDHLQPLRDFIRVQHFLKLANFRPMRGVLGEQLNQRAPRLSNQAFAQQRLAQAARSATGSIHILSAARAQKIEDLIDSLWRV